jgi:hypothetical protein
MMAGKYTPLEHHLNALPISQQEITFSFETIEQILNNTLPPSAYKYQAWWANEKDGRHVHAHAWMNVGWKIESLDINAKWVKFVRVGSAV